MTDLTWYQLYTYVADDDAIKAAGGIQSMSIGQARAQGIVGTAGKPPTARPAPAATSPSAGEDAVPALGGATPAHRTARRTIAAFLRKPGSRQ